tara:strand:- start:225 stop:731 length:507 start_codon:yes stop_codon:yes gene_type:complete
MKSFKQHINEARITIHSAMFNFMNKEIKQLMKKHDAYINSSDKTYTTISTPSASFEKDYRSMMKKHKKKIMQHFKIESSEFTERFDPRGKLDSKDFSYDELQYMNITKRLMDKHDLRWSSGATKVAVALRGKRGKRDIGITGHPNDIRAFKADLEKAIKKMKDKSRRN